MVFLGTPIFHLRNLHDFPVMISGGFTYSTESRRHRQQVDLQDLHHSSSAECQGGTAWTKSFRNQELEGWNPKNYPTVKKCEIVKTRESSGEVWGIPQFHPISRNIGKNQV
jgi:hypothetical protein